jgi:hypothetical protein
MTQAEDYIIMVRKSARKKFLFLPHAVRQMSRPERMVSTQEVKQVIERGEIIEDYLNDPRGHSCLILGIGSAGRPIHVVCSPRENFLTIITAYLPSEQEWKNNFRERRSK